jgi:transposase, IS30 family
MTIIRTRNRFCRKVLESSATGFIISTFFNEQDYMDRKYRRLTITDRTLIGHLKVKGLNQTQIAKLLGFNRSTICRELKRNHDSDFGYNILIAHERTQRLQWIHHRTKIQRDSPLQQHILERLKEGWSPEQIAGRSKLDLGKTWVSHKTIYKYIYSKDGIKDELYKYLRDKRKRVLARIVRKCYTRIRSNTLQLFYIKQS